MNEGQFFLPRNRNDYIKCGFVSSAISGADGTYTVNPILTITMEAAFTFFNIALYFGHAIPEKFILRSYRGGTLIASYQSKDIQQLTLIKYDFIEIDKIEIEFTKAKPYNRIHLMRVGFGEITDYTITYDDLFSTPTGKKLEKIKEMRVNRNIYTQGVELKDLTQEEIMTPETPTTYEFSFSNAVHDLSVVCTVNDEVIDIGAEIIEQKSYWCKVRINNPPATPILIILSIKGYEYVISAVSETMQISNKGKILTWNNPLISSAVNARNLVEWIGNYYSAENEYELEYRGDPALEMNDLAYLESKYVNNLMVRLESIETSYKGSISGKIIARREM